MEDFSYSQMRILETARSFQKLYKIYENDKVQDNAGRQFFETARVLFEALGADVEEEQAEKLKKQAKKRFLEDGIKISEITIYKKTDGRVEVGIRAWTRLRECVKISVAARAVSDVFQKEFVPVYGSRNCLTQTEREYLFEEAPYFYSMSGTCVVSKEKNHISGDSFSCINNYDGASYFSLADGMGTGEIANEISSVAVELMEQLVQTGFSGETSVQMINDAMASKGEEKTVSLDLATVNLWEGTCEFVKLGAAASFIKKSEGVKIVRPSSLPAGVLQRVSADHFVEKISAGDYVIMVSDGVVDALPFYDKEQNLAKIIGNVKSANPRTMAADIMEEILFYLGEKYMDDMTVLVVGIWEKTF